MPRDFLLYWTPATVDAELQRGHPLNHTGSEQLDRVAVGDTLWIVTVRSGSLVLVGRITVAKVTDRDTARRELGYEPWPTARHALAPRETDEPIRELPLGEVAGEMRFRSAAGNDRLEINAGYVNAQQLQTMRELTPECASLLAGVLGCK